jgi:hypothetical protein
MHACHTPLKLGREALLTIVTILILDLLSNVVLQDCVRRRPA